MAQDTTWEGLDKIRGALELSRRYVPPEARQPLEESLRFVQRFLQRTRWAEDLVRHLPTAELRQTLAALWQTERDVLSRAAARAGLAATAPPERDEPSFVLAAVLAALDEASQVCAAFFDRDPGAWMALTPGEIPGLAGMLHAYGYEVSDNEAVDVGF